MAACTYDNPETMRRECWQNGELIYSYSWLIFYLPSSKRPCIFFGANIGDWETGQLVGDPAAINEREKDERKKQSMGSRTADFLHFKQRKQKKFNNH